MPAPSNSLKAALAAGQVQTGCWLALSSPAAAEIAATAGFDWCLIDGEHGPNLLPEMLTQLRALAAGAAHPIVRVPAGEAWMLKQVLDLGVQTVLVPMVDTGEQARELARAVRYPPQGIRGLGSALARASGYNAIADYVHTANDEVCLILQAESRQAIENIDAIAGTEGVDCVFIGPADLAADMGYIGNAAAPEVVEAIDHAIARIRAAGKAAGILAFDPAVAARHLRNGVQFIGMTSDVTALAQSLRGAAAAARSAAQSG